jgi:hypothetical protein
MNITHSPREANQTRPGLIRLAMGSQNESNRVDLESKRDNGTGVKNKERDNGSISDDRHITYGLMDKLCKCALVLIKHKVGADLAVSDRMVRVLKEWLQRRGLTIYTEQYQ